MKVLLATYENSVLLGLFEAGFWGVVQRNRTSWLGGAARVKIQFWHLKSWRGAAMKQHDTDPEKLGHELETGPLD